MVDEIKWKLDGCKVTALLPRVFAEGEMLHLVGGGKLPIRFSLLPQQWPVAAAVAICRINWQDVFLSSILFISCLQRFALRLNSGALTKGDEMSSVRLTAPLPIASLFGRLHCGMKEDLKRCHCLPLILFFRR